MPKKPPKNAFYYFMLDFKEKQQQKGIQYANLGEVSIAADPEWRKASSSLRAKYEQMASHKRHDVPSGQKFTTTGVPLSTLEQQQRELQESIDAEKQDIKSMIKLKAFNNKQILEEDFYVIDVNYYCKTDTEYVIGEMTVLRFNLLNGFRDFYHELVNPGRIPFGYGSDVKLGCEEFGLEMPDETTMPSNYISILAHIVDYLKQSQQDMKTIPPLYTLPDKVIPVQDFINQLCTKAAEDELIFRVYRLDTLFYTLINAIKTNKNEGFPKESLAILQLKKDLFKYTPGLACEQHESLDMSIECTLSRAKRWAYTVLDSCCPIVGIEIQPGQHVPRDFDIEGILTYKDLKKERPLPSVAGFMASASSSCNTTLNESFKIVTIGSTVSEKPKKEKREVPPMRLPQADYSRDMRPAPELTEDDFPPLTGGRGRGLASNRMRFKK